MSEPTAPAAPIESSAPAESSIPETTESIVSSISADLSDAEETTEPTTGTTTTGATGTTTAPVTAPITQAEKDELAEALGITGEGTAKWTTRVAYSKINKAYKALQAKQAEAHAAAVKQHADENAATRQQIAKFDQLVANPDQLLRALAQVNPEYAAFVKGAAPAQTGTPQRIETMADLQAVIQAQVAERLKPIEQERAAAQFEAQAIPKIKAQLAEAATWPLFKEHQTEIQAAVKALPQNLPPEVVLRMAYQQVVVPKLAANRDSVRQSVIEELKTRPHSTSVTTTVAGRSSASADSASTEDIVRNIARGIKD